MITTNDKKRLSPSEFCLYECELLEGETLEGLILSSRQVDIFFVDHSNFPAWMRDEAFDHVCCHKSVSNGTINFLAPNEGSWFLIIENNGKESASLEITVNVSDQ